MQVVLLKVLTRTVTFRRDVPGASFRKWIWAIARHESIQKMRDEGRQPRGWGDLDWVTGTAGGLGDGEVTVPTSMDLELKRRVVKLALAEVEPASRERLLATYRDGRSPAEIAAEAGVSVGSIWTLRSRFRARVRKLWDEERAKG